MRYRIFYVLRSYKEYEAEDENDAREQFEEETLTGHDEPDTQIDVMNVEEIK